VKDLDAAIAFYTGKLGLKHAFDFKDPQGKRFGVYLRAGRRTFIELFTGKYERPAQPPSYQHLCLEVDDFDKTVETLKSRGVEVTGVKLGDDHSWQAWINDPDGNRMELHGYTKESWQAPWLEGK
jgi:catechol 2,3-dioxygenase-like lactoylglutathione lyase family enzyme